MTAARRFRVWGSVALVAAVIAACVWAVWNFELRWRPTTITRNQVEIGTLLKQAGWVSPGLKGAPVYVVCYGGSPDCLKLYQQVFPDLHAKGVDTRVIEIAREDKNGLARSTPVERATVAQLWIGRDWKLLQAWMAAPPGHWNPAGVPPADGDIARTAVIESGRQLVGRLTPLLRANGVRFAYPTLFWWGAKGEMRARVCDDPQTYRFIRREVGG